MKNKLTVELLPHTNFLNSDGTFNKDEAILYCAKLAGECYSSDGWSKLKDEEESKSKTRANFTLGLEHSTPFEHIMIGFEINNAPKILLMALNAERQCSTSEKSARYTKINGLEDQNITDKEVELYDKWNIKFTEVISKYYSETFNDVKIKKLAQENARYLVTTFASMKMIHTVPWVQLNRIISFMIKYTNKENKNAFEERLSKVFEEFISEIKRLNILDDRAMSNRKDRSLALFSDKEVDEYFGYTYSTTYKMSFPGLGQAHRHRTIEYSIKLLDTPEYFIPPILNREPKLLKEWLHDIDSIKEVFPQGMLVHVNEMGTYDKFILKCKERLCSAAQQEIMAQTKDTLTKYSNALEKSNHPLSSEIKKYTKGARCTFPDYNCASVCNFKEGITLERDI